MKVHKIIILFITLVFTTTTALAEGLNDYYYKQLSSTQKEYYNFLDNLTPRPGIGILSFNPSIQLSDQEISTMLTSVQMAYILDHPDKSAWLMNTSGLIYQESDGYTIQKKLYIQVQSLSMYKDGDMSKLYNALNTFTKHANPEWDKYKKALYVNEITKNITRYDLDTHPEIIRTPFCIFYGEALCEGYAKTYKSIADRLNIPCLIVISEDHMYNYVQMPDKLWYLVEPQGQMFCVGSNSVKYLSQYQPQIIDEWQAGNNTNKISFPTLSHESFQYSIKETDLIEIEKAAKSAMTELGLFAPPEGTDLVYSSDLSLPDENWDPDIYFDDTIDPNMISKDDILIQTYN